MEFRGNDQLLSLAGHGFWTSTIALNETNPYCAIVALDYELVSDSRQPITCTYLLPGSTNNLEIHPEPNLAFNLTNSTINVTNLSLIVDNSSVTGDFSNGSSITFGNCDSKVLNISIDPKKCEKITLAASDLKTDQINIIKGAVTFNTVDPDDPDDPELTSIVINPSSANSGISLTVSENSTITVASGNTSGKTLIFDNGDSTDNTYANVTIGAENNAALKICCEADGAICAESVFISSGRVDIQGTLMASLEIQDSAIFSPGNSPGTTNVTNDFALKSGATLLMEIASADASGNDQLFVGGDILLGDNSEIELVLTDNNSLEPGQTFIAILTTTTSETPLDPDVVLSHIKTSDFTELKYVSIDENKYAITGRRFTASEVPEPSTWALLVLGASGLLYWRKKNA